MKLVSVKKLAPALALIVGFAAQSASAQQFTKLQALEVLNVLMSSKTVVNTYGGKYSQVTYSKLDHIGIYKSGGKFEILLSPQSPAINVDEIIVDGVPLADLLR